MVRRDRDGETDDALGRCSEVGQYRGPPRRWQPADGGGGGFSLPVGGGGLGIGAIVILAIIGYA